MACGVPVICSNTGGMPELNKDGFSGFLSDVGDVDSMTRNTLKILETPESLQQYRENAVNHAATFSTQNILPMYENLYQGLKK
jgi:glycosyltransferase involved in cell wall biosynthesis